MNCNFDEIIDRSGTSSLKYEKYKDTDILPMWVADMDFKVPTPVLKILQQSIEHGILGYTIVPDELNCAVIKRLKSLYDWKVEKEWIIWIPGVVSALNNSCKTIGKPQDQIVTTTPIYPPFLDAPGNCEKKLVTVPMVEIKQRATLDFDALENKFKKNTSLFMFCSPYNPCGTVFTRQEINKLVELCAANDVVICSDEIHSDFVLDNDKHHLPTASISQTAAQQTITLMAPSKTYNIPGLGCSFAIIPDERLRQKFTSGLQGLIPHVNLLGLFAATAAYKECDDWLFQLIAYLRKNRDIVQTRINKMKGCKLNPIESTYLAWIDVRQTGLEDPVRFFEQAGVGLSDGRFFGQKGFVRLNFGCPKSVLEKGLNRMETALNKL
ncbi:MalY/PatB family protein [Desulfobacula toluolica]|uniref:cysteine-S-conjugate beta-lyase n=1 Tax=Desulfobacula toluolica (strain DSM 7467 / Tol2) TaxID=651182 RepID=K0N2P8_DESTT|nr:PatB family C-S lyase [Desulfobacula toluolica]CCK78414.1 putative aminotransferase [Desulfobacula toluolica Tol2]